MYIYIVNTKKATKILFYHVTLMTTAVINILVPTLDGSQVKLTSVLTSAWGLKKEIFVEILF